VSTPPIFAAAHGIMGREFMRGLLANQREAADGGGHHERFDCPFIAPPVDTPGQIMTLIDGSTTFFALSCKVGGVDGHGMLGDGPRERCCDCPVATSPVSLHYLDDGRIDVRKMVDSIDCLFPIMGYGGVGGFE
jgi:hypothetical protein